MREELVASAQVAFVPLLCFFGLLLFFALAAAEARDPGSHFEMGMLDLVVV
jgi:hypothetical protein